MNTKKLKTKKFGTDLPFEERKKLHEQLNELSRSELIEFYKIYVDRMFTMDDLTWKIGSIFIPLSLSGVVVGFNEPLRLIFIGAFSIALIWTWFLFFYRNNRYYVINFIVTTTIEDILVKKNITEDTEKGLYKKAPKHLKRIRNKTIANFISYAITIFWLFAIGIAVISQYL